MWSFTKVYNIGLFQLLRPPYYKELWILTGTEGVINGLDTCINVLTICDPHTDRRFGSKEEKQILEKKVEKQHKKDSKYLSESNWLNQPPRIFVYSIKQTY